MTQTAKNYADALYELALDEDLTEQIRKELSAVNGVFAANPDYYSLLTAPNIPRQERLEALDQAFSGRIHVYLLSFLKLLVERGHIRALKDCVLRFRSRYNQDHGILEALAVTAVALRPEQRQKLTERLGSLTGKQVDLRNRVDPSVLGGIRLEYEGKELDGTVRQRLEGLKQTLSETVL